MESIDSYTHRRIMESWRAAKKEADYTGRKKMNWNEYMEQVKEDAIEVIEESAGGYGDWDSLYDELFICDSVTGNGSGSYTFNSAIAAENVCGIIFDQEAICAFRELGYDGIPTEEGAKTCDVIARCIALGLVSGELEKYYEEFCKNEE